MTIVKRGWVASFVLILMSSIGRGNAASMGCHDIDSWETLIHHIDSTKATTIMLCPFSINHAGTMESGYHITKNDLTVICMKRNKDDKCEVLGSARHFNIKAKEVAFVGIDFADSNHGAILVGKRARNFSVISCRFFNNDRTEGDDKDGGAIAVYDPKEQVKEMKQLFITHSHFEQNRARNGGAISIPYGGVSLYSSTFTNNIAKGGKGGAACINWVKIMSNCEFRENESDDLGPAIFSISNSSLELGQNNYACSNLQSSSLEKGYSERACDGISSETRSCSKLSQICEVPSSYPSTLPSIVPSNYPIAKPSYTPTSQPSLKPSDYPSLNPTSEPSTSYAPSTICAMPILKREQLINSTIGEISPSVITDYQSPQQKALSWLVKDDTYNICPYDTNLIQRFVAATIVLSMNITTEDVLNQKHECSWKGFRCSRHSQEIRQISFETTYGGATAIPIEISYLTNLTFLQLQKSSIGGIIPPTISQLPKLQVLDLDKNSIVGSFPSSGKMTDSLEILDINFNQMSGGIDFLSDFPKLREVFIDNNEFSGTIPESIGNLTDLRILTLHGNNLSGTMPDSICQQRKSNGGKLETLMADCDKVICPCCTHCNPY